MNGIIVKWRVELITITDYANKGVLPHEDPTHYTQVPLCVALIIVDSVKVFKNREKSSKLDERIRLV